MQLVNITRRSSRHRSQRRKYERCKQVEAKTENTVAPTVPILLRLSFQSEVWWSVMPSTGWSHSLGTCRPAPGGAPSSVSERGPCMDTQMSKKSSAHVNLCIASLQEQCQSSRTGTRSTWTSAGSARNTGMSSLCTSATSEYLNGNQCVSPPIATDQYSFPLVTGENSFLTATGENSYPKHLFIFFGAVNTYFCNTCSLQRLAFIYSSASVTTEYSFP